MRIDAHQHFWWLGRHRYDWLGAELGVLHADHAPDDLRPHLERHGIDATILVQASDTVEETRTLLEVARATPFVAGVVGWVPLDEPAGLTALRELAEDDQLVGVRPMLQDLDRADWILGAQVEPGLDLVEELGLAFDALVRPVQLDAVVELARRRPHLRIVLDHLGKPDVAAGDAWKGIDHWRRALAALAEHPSVVCKLSGLASEAAPGWTTQDLVPYVAHACRTFGPERLLWGSDWPVVRAAGGYDRWFTAVKEIVEEMAVRDFDAIFRGNAARVYALHGRARNGRRR